MHEDGKTERVHLRVQLAVKERAEKWAERKGISLSAYIRSALNDRMKEDLFNDIRQKTGADE